MRRVAPTLLAALLGSCSGTETGNPPDPKLRVGVHSSNLKEVGVRTQATLEVTEVELAFGALELVGCEQDRVQLVSEPRLLDLFQPEAWSLVPGRYCGVRLGLAPSAVAEAGARVEFVDQAGQHFVYLREAPLELMLDFVQPQQVSAGDVLTLSLDVGLLLGGRDLPPGSSSVTVLSANSNPNEFVPIDVALTSSLNVYSGAHGEGLLTAPP